jgi:Zn-dependent protease/CBS domain-containing protein
MPGSFRLGKIAGIDIYAHVSWLILLVLLTWSLARGWFVLLFPGWSTTTYWIVAFISAMLLFACVLAHELAHAFVARISGLKVRNITLFIFGGVASIDEDMKRPGIEFWVALAGPLASFLIALVAFLLVLPLHGSKTPVDAVLNYLAITNLFVGIFNLIPGFPLDGGRILRSIIWKITGNVKQSTRFASAVGQICAYFFMLLGIVEFFTGNFFNGLWIVFIGWFLLNAAQSAHRQMELQSTLQGVSVGQVMDPHPVTVPANISVQKLVDESFLPLGLRAAPVTQGEYLVGLITLTDIARVPREHWSDTPVGFVMCPLKQVSYTTMEQPLQDILNVMVTQGINQVPVVQEERVVGLLSRDAIMRYLQVQQRLNRDVPRSAA